MEEEDVADSIEAEESTRTKKMMMTTTTNYRGIRMNIFGLENKPPMVMIGMTAA